MSARISPARLIAHARSNHAPKVTTPITKAMTPPNELALK
jgi:hypothetical protein